MQEHIDDVDKQLCDEGKANCDGTQPGDDSGDSDAFDDEDISDM